MQCRPGCAACCIVPSISSVIPGMPHGKPGEVRCCQLTDTLECRVFGHPDRPAVCVRLQPSIEMCGTCAEEAYAYLRYLENTTNPNR